MSIDRRGCGWLSVAAAASFAIALLHLAIVMVGVPAYLFFDAPQRLVQLAYEGSVRPALITLLLALVFTVFGFYALAGAGRGPAMPVVRLALIGISGVYILRGLIGVPQAVMLSYTADVPIRAIVFSAVSFVIGLIYAIGTTLRWKGMPISAVERDPT
jgi:hypothetical protein